MRKITAFILLALLVNFANAQVQSIDIIKEATDNPTIAITAFNGAPEAKQKLERMFALSGWFKVLPTNEAAKAQITVQAAAGSAQYALNLQTSTKKISCQQQGENLDQAARRTVDDIIKQLFNVPGICDRKIIYVQPSPKNEYREICSIYLDGNGFDRLTKNGVISTEPCWGHANAFVYTLAKNNALHIVLVDAAKRVQRVVSSANGLNCSAALSRNGQFVSLAMSLDNQVDLYCLDLATNSRKRLTNDRSVESSPCWSPDGKQLCYVSDATGMPKLYVISTNGGSPKRLQIGGGECVSPDWSPISNKICFSQKTSAGYVINILDMKTPNANPETVTNAAGDWEAPSWAPDGRHIVCTHTTGGKREIVIIDTFFKTFRPVTDKAYYSLPAWQPAW
ncbi:MAG: PD40 domain-containing protein [Victivallales bacterium]|nr:PD40 domain-containing protein [Victivallales bacterium]MBR6057792.1 PD40 domain-containing protein [Victivallales bacterium]